MRMCVCVWGGGGGHFVQNYRRYSRPKVAEVREGEVPALRSIEVNLRNVMVACTLKVHYADYCPGCSKRTFTLISNRRLDLYSF